MTAEERPRRLPDSMGNEHIIIGEGTRLDEHSAARMHVSLCGVVLEERLALSRCPDCAEIARRRGLRVDG